MLAPTSPQVSKPDLPGDVVKELTKQVGRAVREPDQVGGLGLESASVVTDPARRRAELAFVVVGAGYAGVEITAQMGRLTFDLLPLHPGLGVEDLHWLLVDVSETVLPELGSRLGEVALRQLRDRKVDVNSV